MLTADLVRVRIGRDGVHPLFVPVDAPGPQAVAEALGEIFADNVGSRREELNDAVKAFAAGRTDHRLVKGLVKLLEERCTFEVAGGVEPSEARRVVFELAARLGPVRRKAGVDGAGVTRDAVLAQAAAELHCAPGEVDAALFADYPGEHRLVRFEPMEPEALLERYNLALAQGVLLRAHDLTVRLTAPSPEVVRALITASRFHGLSARARRLDDGDVEITLDGPMSLLRLSTRYGVRMARFFPLLVAAGGWSLQARLRWPGRTRLLKLRLSDEDGLRTRVRLRGAWRSDVVEHCLASLRKRTTEWKVDTEPRLLEVARTGELLVPDFALVHPDGRELWVEVLGVWRRGAVEPRLRALRRARARHYLLALSSRLCADGTDTAPEGAQVLAFKGVLRAGALLECAERLAQRVDTQG